MKTIRQRMESTAKQKDGAIMKENIDLEFGDLTYQQLKTLKQENEKTIADLAESLKIALEQGDFTPRVRKILEDSIAQAERKL